MKEDLRVLFIWKTSIYWTSSNGYLPVSPFFLPVVPPEHYPERVTVWIENSQASYMYSKPHLSLFDGWKKTEIFRLTAICPLCFSDLILQLRHCIIHWCVYKMSYSWTGRLLVSLFISLFNCLFSPGLDRQLVAWHRPFCVDLEESTFTYLRSFLERYCDGIGGEMPPAPFPSKR